MIKYATLMFGVWLSSSAWSQAAVIYYDLADTTIGGKDCPLQVSNLKVSADGREITIDNSNWGVSLSGPGDGLLADATCLIRIPTTVPAAYRVLQVNQYLSYSYGKDAGSTVAVYGNSKLFDLADAPIDIKLGSAYSGSHFTVRQTSTANIASWNKWCKNTSQTGFLAINLGLSLVRSQRDRNVWVQLGQHNSPYKVRLDAVSCLRDIDDFLGSVGDRKSSCEPHNRDGLTCAGVGLHSPNAQTCLWQSQWTCMDDGCAKYEGAGDCE